MPTAKSAATRTNMSTLDRKLFLAALNKVNRVVPARTVKPILQGVHLMATDGELQLRATDLDVSVLVRVSADGNLSACDIPKYIRGDSAFAIRTIAA